jgi:hypothetical protein
MAESEKPTFQDMPTVQPGQVVTPGQSPQAQPEQPTPQQPQPLPTMPQTGYALQQAIDAPRSGDDAVIEEDSVSWTASEFIAHEKDAGWYVKLGVAAVVLAVLMFVITRDRVTVGVILFVCIVLGAYANRQPRQLAYRVDTQGVQIGEKWYGYEEFRSFSVMPEGAFSSIALLPLKRFAPLISIYYAPDDEDAIVGILSQALPFEERKHDPVDKLMQRIRF